MAAAICLFREVKVRPGWVAAAKLTPPPALFISTKTLVLKMEFIVFHFPVLCLSRGVPCDCDEVFTAHLRYGHNGGGHFEMGSAHH